MIAIRKILLYVVSIIMFLVVPPFLNAYDRQQTYNYALQWWESCNHSPCGGNIDEYRDCRPWSYWGGECCGYTSQGGDCANFVSQCLIAGEHPYLNDTEPHAPCRGYPCHKEEIGAKKLGDCLVLKGWKRTCGYNQSPPSDIRVGDILIYHMESCTDIKAHATLVTYVNGSDVRIACHSANQWDKDYTYLEDAKPYFEWLQYPDPCPSEKMLVRVSGTDPVYWLQNDKLYRVINAEVINQMSPLPGWGINQINDCDFDTNDFTMGPRFITSDSSSEGLLIRKEGEELTQRVNGNGELESVDDQWCIDNNCWPDIISVTEDITNLFATGIGGGSIVVHE